MPISEFVILILFFFMLTARNIEKFYNGKQYFLKKNFCGENISLKVSLKLQLYDIGLKFCNFCLRKFLFKIPKSHLIEICTL